MSVYGMTVGFVTPWVMPPRPEPTTNATSGLKPANFPSRNSFVSFNFAIIKINPSINLLHDQRQPRRDGFVFDPVCAQYHAFGFGGARVVIAMHHHQRFACSDGITDLLRVLE